MRRALTVTLAAVFVIGAAGVALAHGPGWGYGGGYGMGPGMMGGYGYGGGPAGGGGAWNCPGWGAGPAGQQTQAITEEQAQKLATDYASKYFKGYTVERVLPFSNGFRTMYQAELKGPKGQMRLLHINPWGGVMPFGGPEIEG